MTHEAIVSELETLRQSRQRYEDLVDSVDGIVWEAEPDTVRFTFVSRQAERLLGYPVERWLSEPGFWQDHIHPEDRTWVIPFCALATTEKRPHEFEYRMLAADGRTIWLHDIVTVVAENGRPVKLRGVMVDITGRKQGEAQLQEKEQQYRSIFEASSDGLIINDLETGLVVAANPAVCRMHGYDVAEFIGLHPMVFIHPDDQYLFGDYMRTIQAGGEFRCRARDLRKDGSILHVEVYGTRFLYRGKPHVLGVVRDVTAQVQAQQMLEERVAERTRELSTLLEVSRNVASTLELEPLLGLILDQLKAVTGYSGATILTLAGDDLAIAAGRRPAEQAGGPSLPAQFPAERLGRIWELNRAGLPAIIADVRGDDPLARAYQIATGAYYQTTLGYIRSVLAVPLMLKDRVIGILGLSSTEPDFYTPGRAQLAMAIANHAAIAIENARLYAEVQGKAALEERQRLARELHDSVSQALYGIALGAQTAREVLDRNPAQVAHALDYVLALAEAGLAEMRALIFELRPESLAAEGLVAALTKQAAALRARHGLAVETALGEEPDLPLGAKEALYRITQEAFHNTVKHAQAGAVAVRLESGPGGVRLEIADDGAGFDPAREFPGHLGLRSMRERAERLGGTVQIDSGAGKGTRIRVHLPAGCG